MNRKLIITLSVVSIMPMIIRFYSVLHLANLHHAGLRKHVYIKLTEDDLDECTPKQTSIRILHWISGTKLWWKRKTFNKQVWKKSSCVKFRGVSALSESDIVSLTYKTKIPVSTLTHVL